jgi:outer membrane lipoprotein-sorting protein
MYMQLQGRWMARPYDGQKIASDARQAMDKSGHDCTRAGSEAVEGQPADLYVVRSKTAQGTSESKIWISPSSGLPLRQHTTLIEGATASGKHDVVYDYKDVKAPPGVN